MGKTPRDYPLDWAYAYGEPGCHGTIRSTPEEFQVDEVLGYQPDGEGNHALLHLRKRNTNTEWLARQLAQFASVEPKEVGYAGLKDRHAVTTQYFSVNLSGRAEPDWSALNSDDVQILEVARHGRKLRRGGLRENRFVITLRDLHGDCGALQQRLQRISEEGVPNYFGEQRFGRDGNNLRLADGLFSGVVNERDRHRRGLYLSAARSWLFNCVLSERVAAGNWQQALPGEALLQPYSRSTLTLRVINDEIRERIRKGMLQPSAPLWGKGVSTAQGAAAELEKRTLAEEGLFRHGLEAAGMEQERRALRLLPRQLQWQWLEDRGVRLSFSLPAGGYATAVLRELVQLRDAAR